MDIGNPIDDTFALTYILKKQENQTFDIRLISTVGANATARAVLLSKFLEETGYSKKVDIGIGISSECGLTLIHNCVGLACKWMDQFHGYTLLDYEGIIYHDAIQRIIKIIEEYSEINPIYFVTLGAFTNLAQVISQRPDLRKNIKLFSMSGSLFNSTPWGKFAEYNIMDDIPSAQIIYNQRNDSFCSVPWDTGYYFQIKGEQYQRLLNAMDDDLLIYHTIKMYEVWYGNGGSEWEPVPYHPTNATPPLFDLEIVWMAAYVADMDGTETAKQCNQIVDYLVVEAFNIYVNDTGYITEINDSIDTCNNLLRYPVYFASQWKDEQNGTLNVAIETVNAMLLQKTSNSHTEL